MIVPSVSNLGPARERGTFCESVRSVALASSGLPSLAHAAFLGSRGLPWLTRPSLAHAALLGSRGHLLAGTAPRSLARDRDAALEDLAAPDTPGLAPVQSAGQAGRPHRAAGAEA